MTENMKKFLEQVSRSEELTKKLNSAQKEDIIAMAKDLGVALTEADFTRPSGELDDDELTAVAGGAECVCVMGGGGTATRGEQLTCACVLGGGGELKSLEDGSKQCRCACVATGYGEDCF